MLLTRQDKIIAALLVSLSVVGAAADIFQGIEHGFATMRILTSTILIGIGLAGAYGSIKGRRSGALLGNLFFLVQIPQFESPDFVLDLSLEPMFVVSAVSANSGLLGVNLIAAATFLWSSIRMASSGSPFREVLPRPAVPKADSST